ncbi:anti-codon nuclease masking agent [Campylobacter jejuni subsp. doylei]|uniref:Anti-codon nuclease masking agent n=1 Tax=Campylobacter jejuni subsp. doylei TaxID=32021 RepID=A0A3S4VWR4_CAMJU|nr:anti-codon nuclease masking agent [Campylobacter jejuni subsp. doylei]
MKKKGIVFLSFVLVLEAQNIDISKFYYRDYLDFGQNKGAFSGNGSTTITGKDGKEFPIPQIPNFSASSNYGSLTSVGRGFAVTANHVSSPESQDDLRKWGLTTYNIARQTNGEVGGISKAYGSDTKFLRFDKYVVEGQVDMLNSPNNTNKNGTSSTSQESQNLENFKNQIENLRDSNGNIYLYQAGSGIVSLRGTSNPQGTINPPSSGEMRGGGFGTLERGGINYQGVVNCNGDDCISRGISFNYKPDSNFQNIITSGDSGSGIYAYDSGNQKWILLGVTSQTFIQIGGDEAKVSFASNKDLQDYQSKFEQKIDLNKNSWTLEKPAGGNIQLKNGRETSIDSNKDLIFSGGGNIEVKTDIDRMQSGQAGGFVFTADSSATSTKPTTYTFTNANGKTYLFKGSGLDIGEHVKVEWALRNKSNDSLHKIGKGELIVKTNYTPTSNENLGYLKIGEGKVTLDTTTKAFENIYITSGRGELALVSGKAQALGATKNDTNSVSGATSANSYTLAQDSTDKMGFYFGKGGGKFDLAGNSLVLNTIAANDSKAIITNSDTSLVDLEIQGFGYENNTKTSTKADTIIHASIGDNANGANGANLNLIYKGDKTAVNRHSSFSTKAQNDSTASLIFDGHINIKGALKAENANIVLQGHPTTHATISDTTIANKVQSAESGTGKPMPNYMDLSKPSNLQQPDWDSRNFSIANEIDLKNATLTVGKAAHLNANITADNTSQINFGGKHFIDSKDGKNVIGSGFSYQQGVTSGDLLGETYKDSSYSGTITADGTTITSKFMNFAPNLELKNGAKLSATNLTLNTNSNLNLSGNSSAQVENLIFKNFTNNDFASKFTLKSGSTFSVTQALSFDKSTFDLSKLSSANSGLTLPTAYNLYVFNDSNITATTFTNSKENAEFMLDNSTFKATSASFKSAELTLKNGAQFSANSLNFTENSIISLADSGKLTLTGDLQTQSLNLNLSNSSTLNAKSLTSNGASTINLNDKATLTLENALSSKDLTLTLKNASTFTANTLTASGVVNLNADTNSNIKFSTLNLQNGNLQNISQNVAIEKLNLTESKANLELLNGQIPKTIDLKTQSNLHFNELNFNTNNIKLTSDDSSKAYIKRLIYDASNAQANSTNTALQSNIVISEKFELKNVGQNLSTTTGTQNTQGAPSTPSTEQDKLNKDLFTLKFDKNLELGNGASLDISFAKAVKKDNKDLLFNKDYTIFSANSLTSSNHLQVDFKNSNGTSFGETDFYIKGKLDKDKNAFSVQFVRENPRNFSELNPHIDPSYSPFLEILLQHNKFDKNVDKAVNLSDYSALQERLISLDKSFKDVANSSSNVLETLPLLQRHNINKRIQNQRFTGAKYAYNEERYNPLQKSDFIPALLYLDKMEKEERVWSNVGGGYFTKDESKMSLQSVSVGYDKKLLSNEFLFGVMASITQMQLSHSADEFKQNPQIYSLTFYSNALFGDDELQNELGFSFFNDKRHIGDQELSAGGVGTFFNSLYKFKLSFLPQNFKPLILANVNFNSLNAIDTPTYIQKPYKDLSFDVGLGFELDFEKENGFYNISFIAQQDIYHSKDEVLVSLAKSDKFIPYKSNDPSLSYQLRLMGLENFNNGMFLRYSLSGFIDTKAYKGVSADIQLGYKY